MCLYATKNPVVIINVLSTFEFDDEGTSECYIEFIGFPKNFDLINPTVGK